MLTEVRRLSIASAEVVLPVIRIQTTVPIAPERAPPSLIRSERCHRIASAGMVGSRRMLRLLLLLLLSLLLLLLLPLLGGGRTNKMRRMLHTNELISDAPPDGATDGSGGSGSCRPLVHAQPSPLCLRQTSVVASILSRRRFAIVHHIVVRAPIGRGQIAPGIDGGCSNKIVRPGNSWCCCSPCAISIAIVVGAVGAMDIAAAIHVAAFCRQRFAIANGIL